MALRHVSRADLGGGMLPLMCRLVLQSTRLTEYGVQNEDLYLGEVAH